MTCRQIGDFVPPFDKKGPILAQLYLNEEKVQSKVTKKGGAFVGFLAH
jgi:hypothetical protein